MITQERLAPFTDGGGGTIQSTNPAFTTQESMMQMSFEANVYFKSLVTSAEAANIDLVRNRYSPSLYNDLLALEKKSLGEGIMIASIESAAYAVKHPELLTFMDEFPTTFRLLRTAEMCGGLERGGNTLLIGSGGTYHEVFATHIAPPSEEDIENVFSSDLTEDALLKKVLLWQPGDPVEIPLLPGKVIAIEPDSGHSVKREQVTQTFIFPEGLVDIRTITIGEAFRDELIPDNLDTVLWHRADPQICGLVSPDALNQQTIDLTAGILQLLLYKLRENGGLVITVGAGNSIEDRKTRELFMKLVNHIFKGSDIPLLTELSGYYIDEVTSAYFGEPVGAFAGVIAMNAQLH